MNLTKKNLIKNKEILNQIYQNTGGLKGVAETVGVPYSTARKLVKAANIKTKQQGYNAPALPFTGKQCRLAREYLGYTRNEMCQSSGVGKTALSRFEQEKDIPRLATIEKITIFFKTRNILFLDKSIFFVDTSKK